MNFQPKEINILMGIHGCGKSSYARARWKNHGYILSWEDVQRDYKGEPLRVVYRNYMHRLKQALLDKRLKFSLIVIDSTNLEFKQRSNIYTLIEKHCPNAIIYMHYFEPDITKALFWNSRKPQKYRATPRTILEDYKRIQYPYEVAGNVVILETPPPKILKERNASRKWKTAEDLLNHLLKEVRA